MKVELTELHAKMYNKTEIKPEHQGAAALLRP
jgi:hypothetical protein